MGTKIIKCDTVNHPSVSTFDCIGISSAGIVSIKEVDINDGEIDNTRIGYVTKADGYFASLRANSFQSNSGQTGAIYTSDVSTIISWGTTGSASTLVGPVTITTDLLVNGDSTLGNALTDTVTLNGTMSGGKSYTGMPGEIRMYGGATEPTGWIFCDGQSLNTYTYAPLHAVITNNYGGTAFNGGTTDVQGVNTTFNAPNFKGRTPVGEGTGVDGTNTATGNAPTGNPLTARNLGAHGGAESETLSTYQNTNSGTTNTWYAKSGATLDNIPPMMVVNFIIKT